MLDIELYGGKRGLLTHVRARTMYALGAYHDVRGIEWSTVRRLAFVCKGNICRSPYAWARARSMGALAASFGLCASEGAPADSVASRNALSRGLDLSGHRSARLESARISDGDLAIVFEPEHLAEVRRLCIGRMAQVSLLGIWTQPILPHVQDPFGLSDRYFQHCFSVIDANIAKLVEYMTRHGAPAVTNRAMEPPGVGAAHAGPPGRTFA